MYELKRIGRCPNGLFLEFTGIFVVYMCDSLHITVHKSIFPSNVYFI